ncbi:MAG TPA: hypothetical protein PKG56_03605 [Chitinophagaceae bacterium]|nr:hypothetical protein [Chitinophagaceae bacterium]HNL82451.1 hypothetical protein [Chitinophagaceae bacterium]HNM35104.1 hypothetical protein [Chitinophagaceae bacterium]
MKKVLVFLFSIILFTSCSKQDNFIEPTNSTTGNQLFYRDAHLAIQSFTLSGTNNNSIQIDFSTLYEKNISKIEIMSGETPNYLCAVYTVNLTINSAQLKNYSVTDSKTSSSTAYYMIKYTLNNGDFGFTNVIKYQRNK